MSMSRSGRIAGLVLAAGILGAASVFGPAAAFGGARSASGHNVVLKNIRFHPSNLTIHRNDTVTWLWRDEGTEHNVTFHSFHSHTMGHGSFTVRFKHTGTFNYHCTIHGSEGMVGKIVVR
jgi:plastocyanin